MESLLQRIASGDPAAVQQCIERYGPLVWSIARRLCTPSEAEDAVQEVFIDLWKSAARYDPALSSEPSFVALVARRRLIDLRRRAGRRGAPAELPEALPSEEAPSDDAAAERDEAERARRALDELRPEQKRVLELSVWSGMSHQQIAEATDLPLGTVKTHARRGLLRLRELLGAAPEATSLQREEGPA